MQARATRARSAAAIRFALAACVAGCTTTPVQTPTRSLDGPTSAALVCASGTGGGDPAQTDGGTSAAFGNLVLHPLSDCQSLSELGYGDQPAELYLLIANGTRGELAVASVGHPDGGTTAQFGPANLTTSITAGVLDLDPRTPGYGFLPLGQQPEPIRATPDGSIAVSTNRGTCDLTTVDVRAVLARATACQTPNLEGRPAQCNADALVGDVGASATRVVPTVNGKPLGARPTWVEWAPGGGGTKSCSKGHCVFVAMPGCGLVVEVDLDATGDNVTQALRVGLAGASPVSDLSSLSCPMECAPPLAGAASDAGATDAGAIDLGAPNPADLSAAVSDGGAGDAGESDGGAAHDAGSGDAGNGDAGGGGGGGTTLPSNLPTTEPFPYSLAIDAPKAGPARLVVGDAVTPRVLFTALDAATGALGATTTVTLSDTAGGVERLSITGEIAELAPPGSAVGRRFVYAIARDRTVRVVDVDLQAECETNPTIDAVNAALAAAYGNPASLEQAYIADIETGTLSQNADTSWSVHADGWKTERALACMPVGTTARSPLALTAGIALPGNALPRDVSFAHPTRTPVPAAGNEASAAIPSVMLGWFAWIVDSSGRASVANIADLCPQPNDPGIGDQAFYYASCNPARFGLVLIPDPSNTSTNIPVHALPPGSPGYDVPTGGSAPPSVSPFDVLPHHLRNGEARWLATGTNGNADATAFGAVRIEDATLPVTEIQTAAVSLADPSVYSTNASICDVDPTTNASCTIARYGNPENATAGNFLAVQNPDLPTNNETWTIAWEGPIPGTNRATGTVTTTTAAGATVSALSDPSGGLCSRGVEAGDKLVMLGCGDDSACGPSQYCFRNLSGTIGSTGLCLDRPTMLVGGVPQPVTSFDETTDTTGGACDPFLKSVLHYRVTTVTQAAAGSTLALDELPLPEHPVDQVPCTAGGGECAHVSASSTVGSTPQTTPTACLPIGGGELRCLAPCENGGCPEGYFCAPSIHDAPGAPPRCLRAPLLPRVGAACTDASQCGVSGTCSGGVCASPCFKELQSYELLAGESFVVTGSVSGFLHADAPDPTTGACAPPQSTDPDARRTGRIPIDPPACAPALRSDWLGPVPPGAPAACLLASTAGERDLRFQDPYLGFVVHVPTRQVMGSGVVEVAPCDGGAGADMGPCEPFLLGDGGVAESAVTRVPPDFTNLSFIVVGGFRPMSFGLGSDIVAQMPRASVIAPDSTTMFVVDEGRQSTATGLRGQVVKFATDTQTSDSTFQIR